MHPIDKCDEQAKSCVRFCCDKYSCVSDSNLNIIHFKEAENLTKSFSIVKGLPCEHSYQEDEGQWRFFEVQGVFFLLF